LRRFDDLAYKVGLIESVGGDLEPLLTRLQALEDIKRASGSFQSRVSATEGAILSIQTELKTNDDKLRQLKDTLVKELDVIKLSISKMDRAIAAKQRKHT